jgi:hypothetical protein
MPCRGLLQGHRGHLGWLKLEGMKLTPQELPRQEHLRIGALRSLSVGHHEAQLLRYSLRFNIDVVPTEIGSSILVQVGCRKRQYFRNGVVSDIVLQPLRFFLVFALTKMGTCISTLDHIWGFQHPSSSAFEETRNYIII